METEDGHMIEKPAQPLARCFF